MEALKIVLWINAEPNQVALAHKIHKAMGVTAIVAEKRVQKRKLTVKILFEKVIEKLFLRKINAAWFGMQQLYQKQYPALPNVPILHVSKINDDSVYNFTQQHKPDIIIVSGTALIKDKLLSINPRIGILNLHTGLSPYIKGGPNCTNWCIATGQFHLIGNTIMWIDAGIDTGNIIATEFTPLSGNETFAQLHIAVMEHAHDLYLRTILKLAKEEKTSGVAQQKIAEGKTYYTKQWNLKQKWNLMLNWKKYTTGIANAPNERAKQKIVTVNL